MNTMIFPAPALLTIHTYSFSPHHYSYLIVHLISLTTMRSKTISLTPCQQIMFDLMYSKQMVYVINSISRQLLHIYYVQYCTQTSIIATCLLTIHTGNGYVLYCIVLYCIVLYCIVLYCIVLYCIVLYCTVLYCIY